MLCPNCRKPVGIGATECLQCGTKIATRALRQPIQSDADAPSTRVDPFFAWPLRIIGFVVGLAATFVLEYLFFLLLGEILGRRMMPRGIGWVIMPFLAGVSLGAIAPELPVASRYAKRGLQEQFRRATVIGRFVVVAPLFWAFCVGAYVLIFEPYGYRILSREYAHMAKVILYPSGILIVGYFVYQKFIRTPDKKADE